MYKQCQHVGEACNNSVGSGDECGQAEGGDIAWSKLVMLTMEMGVHTACKQMPYQKHVIKFTQGWIPREVEVDMSRNTAPLLTLPWPNCGGSSDVSVTSTARVKDFPASSRDNVRPHVTFNAIAIFAMATVIYTGMFRNATSL